MQAKKREMKDELKQFRETRQEAAAISSSGGGAAATRSGGVEARVSKAESAFARLGAVTLLTHVGLVACG